MKNKHSYAMPLVGHSGARRSTILGGGLSTPNTSTKTPPTRSPILNSGNTIPIPRGSTIGRLGESINAILKFDEDEDRAYSHNQDPLLLPTVSNAVMSWQQLDTELGACVVLTGEECTFKKMKGKNERNVNDKLECVGFKRPDGPSLALYSSQEFTKMTGYLPGDIVATDLSCIKGSRTNRSLWDHTIMEAMNGKIGHSMLTFKRRDNNHFSASVHAFPVYSSDVNDHEIKAATKSPKITLSSLFSRSPPGSSTRSLQATINNKMIGVKGREIGDKQPKPMTMNSSSSSMNTKTTGELQNRESDIFEFRPSYLLHNDNNESSQDVTVSDMSRLMDDYDHDGDKDPNSMSVIQGNVSLSLERQESYSEESRWMPISETEYASSPVLFIVLNFKVLQNEDLSSSKISFN